MSKTQLNQWNKTNLAIVLSITMLSVVGCAVKAYADYDVRTNGIIDAVVDMCGEMDGELCINLMNTVDLECRTTYNPACFGDRWSEFVDINGEDGETKSE